ncbi:hypothetical protein B296_00019401 [Ensete ventricosum]|uniref:Uncharacterized protein n=1 Tax=Ensete ventricosum TaxID=4639 RepID=A0A426ZBM9_ENSVE|nr:hypothetical protein B296_00019401 [Ensete ventricosum]
MELQSTRVMRVTTENDGHSDVGDMARCLGSATSAAAAAAASSNSSAMECLSEILLRRQVSALRFPLHPNRPPMSSPNRNLHATDEMDDVITHQGNQQQQQQTKKEMAGLMDTTRRRRIAVGAAGGGGVTGVLLDFHRRVVRDR